MNCTRRSFLVFGAPVVLAGVSVLLITRSARAGVPPGQQQTPRPSTPALPNANGPEIVPAPGPALPDPKTILKENQKEIKKDVDQLYKLSQELKEESEKTDAYNVLSLPMIRKAEEIEKLAKKIKDRAKGS
jgi:hypothetical protein